MNRSVLALAGLLAMPVCALAQDGIYAPEPHPQQLPHTRFAVTPFVGARMPFSTGSFHLRTSDGREFIVEQEREGSYAVGVNAEARLSRTLGLIAGVTYSGAGQDVSTFSPAVGGTNNFQIDGPSYWFVKAGASWRLPDPVRDTRRFHPSALITIAPALVITDFANVEGFPALSETNTQFGVNLGLDAMARLGQGKWAVTLGIEDYVTFWNEEDLAEREALIWSYVADDDVTAIDFDYGTSNILLLRVGVSYRP